MSEPNLSPVEDRASSFRNLIDALVSPREAFTRLAGRPVFALALLLLVVSGAALTHVAMSKVTPQDFIHTIEESGREVPQQLRDDPEKAMKVAHWAQVGSAVVLGPVLYLALGGIFLVIFRLGGSELTFRQSMATTVHGMAPFAVLALLGIVVVYARGAVSLQQIQAGGLVTSSLGFLAGEGASKVTQALLTSIDLFSAWCVFLLAMGFRIVGRISSGAAWTGVLAVWIVGILIKVGLAAIF